MTSELQHAHEAASIAQSPSQQESPFIKELGGLLNWNKGDDSQNRSFAPSEMPLNRQKGSNDNVPSNSENLDYRKIANELLINAGVLPNSKIDFDAEQKPIPQELKEEMAKANKDAFKEPFKLKGFPFDIPNPKDYELKTSR